eukprot:TRINITY_DN8532_c0_g1_i1.p1 TRINITY_DN8532_c0_g1~~TRINITY_DN8532_c0_g1_i1.p1  ORF type:complete len:258 (+),score=50.28 TRINITY_DN8532_c0_g1_i1:48-821(+)
MSDDHLFTSSPTQLPMLYEADETASVFLRKTAQHGIAAPSHHALSPFFSAGIRRGSILSFQGPSDGTQHYMLRLWIVQMLLPDEILHRGKYFKIGGYQFRVVCFDMHNRMCISELRRMIVKVIEDKMKESHPDLMQELEDKEILHGVAATCLRRLHIIRCENNWEFYVHLKLIKSMATQDENMRGLVIDSIDALTHMDRLGENIGIYQSPLIAQVIEELAHSYRVLVVASQTDHSNSNSDAPPSHLGKPWNKLVNHR